MQSGSHLVPSLGKTSVTGPSRRDAWRAEPAVLLGWSEVRLLNVKVDVEAVACALSFSFDGDTLPGGRQNVVTAVRFCTILKIYAE